jgi:hypothetical protein
MKFRENWESGRPPGVEKKVEKALFSVALAYRNELRMQLEGINLPIFALAPAAVDDLAVAVAGLAEDLHADARLWRSLETCNTEMFGVPLPLIFRDGDAELETFDARRFQFFLYSLWRYFQPDFIVSPTHRGFVDLAEHAAVFFSRALPKLPRKSPVADFLRRQNHRGWSVKHKLIWLGTCSFLFRLFHRDYRDRNESGHGEEIDTTDDFLCQECTAWSGLGAVDLLAAVLDLPREDKETLRGWHERHVAVYRIGGVSPDGRKEELLEAVNEINGQPYRIRMEMDPRARPFQPGMLVFGSLVPWRGEWYWSGAQRIMPLSLAELAELRKRIRQNGSFSYRYCLDLELKAREFEAKQCGDFVEYYRGDFAVFPDGATAAATEGKRLKLPGVFAGITGEKDRVAIFYNAGEGQEAFTQYGTLLSALEMRDGIQTGDEGDTLRDFMESDAISPAFVRRVIREQGSAGIEAYYHLPEEAKEGIEYLLRRFKGSHFRKRYPSLSLRE